MTDPFGLTTTYLYNDDNQLVQVRTSNTTQAEYVYRDGVAQSDANYLKSSQLYQTKQASGQITTTYTNDGFGRLTNLLQAAVGLTRSYTYGYDKNDNRRSKRNGSIRFDIISRGDGTTNSTFTYDELDRIITSSEGSETYTYDGKGNRLTLQSSIQMPHKDNVDYTYNQAEQLGKVVRNQTSVSYKYNGDGLMTERSVTKNGQATTTRYYYDGMNIIAEGSVAANGTVTFKARYVRGAQLIYREDANNQKAYYLHNGHGDVTALLKADGTVLNRYTYDIWGNPLTSDVQVENPFGYSGEFWDGDTGLQYLRSRWYDPSIGRFIQEDTFEGYVNRPSSLNPYTYVENNPLKYVDPSGHFVFLLAPLLVPVIEAAAATAMVSYAANETYNLFAKKSKSSNKERSTDVPSWAKGEKPRIKEDGQVENGKEFAERLMNERYGEGEWTTKSKEYGPLKKNGDRGHKN